MIAYGRTIDATSAIHASWTQPGGIGKDERPQVRPERHRRPRHERVQDQQLEEPAFARRLETRRGQPDLVPQRPFALLAVLRHQLAVAEREPDLGIAFEGLDAPSQAVRQPHVVLVAQRDQVAAGE
jgi:hypothetical protein